MKFRLGHLPRASWTVRGNGFAFAPARFWERGARCFVERFILGMDEAAAFFRRIGDSGPKSLQERHGEVFTSCQETPYARQDVAQAKIRMQHKEGARGKNKMEWAGILGYYLRTISLYHGRQREVAIRGGREYAAVHQYEHQVTVGYSDVALNLGTCLA